MALDDFRVLIDVAAADGRSGLVGLELDTDGLLHLEVHEPGAPVKRAGAGLDYSDAGLLLDAIREGMGVMLARAGDPVAAAAVVAIHAARDTPAPADA